MVFISDLNNESKSQFYVLIFFFPVYLQNVLWKEGLIHVLWNTNTPVMSYNYDPQSMGIEKYELGILGSIKDMRKYQVLSLTLSHTFLGLYVTVVQDFLKHCGKMRNCLLELIKWLLPFWKLILHLRHVYKITTRGLRWPGSLTWVIFPTIEFYIFVPLVPTCDPQGGATFDSKGIIWIRLIKVHKEMLNTKYQSSNPFSFREEEFWSWFSLFLYSNLWPLGQGQFWPHKHHINKLGRGP